MKKNILFVCVENANRSQMAQAFANMLAKENVNVYSAGSRPSGVINPKAVASMKELGYNMSNHESKSLDEIPDIVYDYVVTMGCGDECPFVKANHREDWNIPDPKNMPPDEFNKVRDTIKEKVGELLDRL